MAADPTLADRLDNFGDKPTDADAVLHLGRVQPEPFRSYLMMVARDLDEGQRLARAAAVRLRKLDDIEEAAAAQGDADGLHLLADGLRGFRFTSSSANFIDRIADALGGTE